MHEAYEEAYRRVYEEKIYLYRIDFDEVQARARAESAAHIAGRFAAEAVEIAWQQEQDLLKRMEQEDQREAEEEERRERQREKEEEKRREKAERPRHDPHQTKD